MLDRLDDALKRVLERRGIDEPIVFDTPDAEWGARVSQPTLNVFLWDIRRSLDQSGGRDLVATESGDRVWRRQRPRVEFHYLVTAWTTVVADEHRLLGDALLAILGCDGLVGDDRPSFVPDGDAAPTIRVVGADGKDLADFWGAIDGKLKPGLNVVVTTPVDPGLRADAGPRTTVREFRGGLLGEEGRPVDPVSVTSIGWEHDAVGALVTASTGEGSSDEAERQPHVARVQEHVGGHDRNSVLGKTTYLVEGAPGDRITITTDEGVVEEYVFPPAQDPATGASDG